MAKKPLNQTSAQDPSLETTPVNKETKLVSAGKTNLIDELFIGIAEQTYKRSGYVPESYKMPYNPDDIYQKRGNYTIYEDMLNDDQVSICSNLKKDLILGSGYSLVPSDSSQIEMCHEIQEALENLDGDMTFLDKVREMLDGYEMGFSITEKLFKVQDDGKLALRDLLTRHPNSFLIYQDAHGNITKFEQKSTEKGDISINPKSIIHFVNNPKYQNPYGKSDLRPAYNAWFVKRQVIRFLGIFLESSAKPIPVGRYDVNSPEGTADELLEILQSFQVKTAIAIPKEILVDFLEAKSNGEAFHKAINIFNMFIGRAMFIPDLLGMSGSETGGGSLALGKEQMNIFFMHINRRKATIEKIIQKHLIKTMCLYNYGELKKYPQFKLNALDDQAAVELAKVWLEIVKSKIVKPTEEEINHFRKLVKFPEGVVELIESQPQQLDENGNPLPPNAKPNDPKEGSEKENERSEKENDKPAEKTFAKVYNLPKGDYHKKVDFKAAANKLNDYDSSINAEVQPIVKRMYSDLYDRLQKMAVIESHKIEKLDSLSLKYKSELKKSLKQSFMSIYKDGQVMAAHELNKSDFALPTTSDEFLALLEAETFAFIGKYEYAILEKVRTQIVAAIKDGRPLSSVIDVLDNEGKKLSQVSLERFARTKHTEVLNRGRHDYFQNSGVVAAYQYSAILDDRTSEICSGLDGKIFAAGTEPIPPLHFNCRSLLIPITKYEDWEADSKVGKTNIQDFIEENKGESFATFSNKSDENSDFKTDHPDEKTEVITYFTNGRAYEKITLVYSDYTKTKIESKVTEQINEKV